MTRLLDSPLVDPAAVAAALDGLRDRGATCQAYMRAGGSNVCVNAVNAGSDAWPRYSESASRRAATGGRRLLPVIDSGEVDGRLWIAYDMGSATSLADARGRRLLPTATSLRVLLDVARALDGAAAEGVFACELPPGSMFLSGKGARLGDLGTAREVVARVEYELEGDPAYVPPEVLRGQRAGERSGVYLFGALMHYLLTGGPPYNARPGPPANGQPELPASIKAVVATATAEDPEVRPPTVSEAHDMARRALRGEPPARPRKQRPAAKRASKPAAAMQAAPKRVTPKPEAAKRGSARRVTPKPEAAKLEAAKPPIRRRLAARGCPRWCAHPRIRRRPASRRLARAGAGSRSDRHGRGYVGDRAFRRASCRFGRPDPVGPGAGFPSSRARREPAARASARSPAGPAWCAPGLASRRRGLGALLDSDQPGHPRGHVPDDVRPEPASASAMRAHGVHAEAPRREGAASRRRDRGFAASRRCRRDADRRARRCPRQTGKRPHAEPPAPRRTGARRDTPTRRGHPARVGLSRGHRSCRARRSRGLREAGGGGRQRGGRALGRGERAGSPHRRSARGWNRRRPLTRCAPLAHRRRRLRPLRAVASYRLGRRRLAGGPVYPSQTHAFAPTFRAASLEAPVSISRSRSATCCAASWSRLSTASRSSSSAAIPSPSISRRVASTNRAARWPASPSGRSRSARSLTVSRDSSITRSIALTISSGVCAPSPTLLSVCLALRQISLACSAKSLCEGASSPSQDATVSASRLRRIGASRVMPGAYPRRNPVTKGVRAAGPPGCARSRPCAPA